MQSLIQSQIEALEASIIPDTEQSKLSFQEQNQFHIMTTFANYFHNIQDAFLKNPSSKIYNKLLNEYTLIGNSLWSQSKQIMSFIQEVNKNQGTQNSFIFISHLHYHSQSPLFGLYSKIMGHRVRLIGSKKQIERGWGSSTILATQLDKKTAFKNLMAAEGIELHFVEQGQVQQIQYIQNKQCNQQLMNINIFDFFNTHATLYRPYFLKQLSKGILSKNNNSVNIIYIHPSQLKQLSQFFKQVEGLNKIIHTLNLSVSFPQQTSTIFSSKFEEQLTIFLNEQLNYPNKQDIIIFHEQSEQFIKRIKHMIKKNANDLQKHVKIIYKPNQNQKISLPPCPSFLNQISGGTTSFSQKDDSKIRISRQESVMKEKETDSKIGEIKNENSSTISRKTSQNQGQKNIHSCNNIYIVSNYKTLIQWNYDISHVFYVFDFRNDKTFSFAYDQMVYVESSQQYISQKQALCRISCISCHKIGKYCFVKSSVQDQNQSIKQNDQFSYLNDRKTKDIGVYCLEMIEGAFPIFYKQLEQIKQVKDCANSLLQAKIIRQENGKFVIANEEVVKCVKKIRDLNPILCSMIFNAKHGVLQQNLAPSKLALLLAMATSIIMTPGSMRQINNNNTADRPTQIWRQSGYLHSAIDILVRAKIIQMRESANTHKKSKKSVSKKLSKQTSQEFDVFGNLFQVLIADRITFDQMKIQDLLREQIVNEDFFHKVVDSTQKICEILDLEDVNFTSFEDINAVLADIIKNINKSVGIYSGSRRVGYFMHGKPDGIFPSKMCLLTTLNQRPSFVFITRLSTFQSLNGTIYSEILMCNNISEITLVQTLGMLPQRKTNSYGQTQLQYHGVASATFKNLWRNNGSDIEVFQSKFNCLVEPHEQIAIISIHCPKEKQKTVKQQFDILLNRVKQKMASQTKIAHYLGTTSLLLGTGGKVIQAIKDKYINKCALSNLDLSVQVEDLQQLFEQFFVLKDIKIVRQPPSAPFKTAYIQFVSQKDYYRFYEYYNQCKYLDRYIKVVPIESIPASSSSKQQMYLQFVWNVWKSHQKAIVQYEQQQMAEKCLESLKTQKLDGVLVKAEIRGNTKVYMEGLNILTDEVNLQKALENYGKIKLIQILKTPSKQNLKAHEIMLQDEIRKAFDAPIDISVKTVEKLKNGLRKCKVVYKDQNKLNETITKLNQKTGKMGIGRVHIESWFVYPVKVAHGYLHLYQQLVEYSVKKMPNNRIKIQNIIFNEQEYIVAKSHLKQQLDLFKNNINSELQGYVVDLTGLQISILLSETGIQNLIDLQEKYNCRLIPNFQKKTLSVVTLFENCKTIKQEIKAKVQDNFFYRIALNHKSFKHFKENPQLCTTMKNQYHLAELELEEVGKNLLLQGSANNVEKAFNYLMHVIQSVSKPAQEEMLNADVCGICCQQPYRPYRLQQCGHKFCLTCLLDNINMSLGDITMFPVKCPQCLGELAIVDLEELMTGQTWPKLNSMALNQYVGRNPEIISSCYTAGCKQVNFLIKNHFTCDECQQSYCIECKMNYHPGLTCQQAKQGGNAAFEKYMKENGIRKCPNSSCKMPIMRLDGCYRVTCSRCNKSMCFKCEPDKMIAYDHYNDCYKHLTDVHGGYW